MANPAVVVDFLANTKQLQQGFDDASRKSQGFASKLKGLGKAGLAGAAAAGVAGLTAAIKIGVDEFMEAQKVGAQTNAVLKSTGGAAKVSAEHVGDLAESLMKKSGVDDEAIQSGENLLLTFTNVRNEAGKGNAIFDQATKAALDMSVAMGTDLNSAAMNVGKALNDPVKGMTKLQRVGVTFTDQQKKQVEALVKSGKTAQAQKIILGELNKEFGGSAKAAGKTLPGQINILKQTFSNLAGDLVAKVIPVIQSTVGWLRDHWPQISAAFASMWAVVQPILDGLWKLLKTVADVIIQAWPLVSPLVEGLAEEIKNMGKVVAGVINLVVDLIHGDWKKAWEDLKKIAKAAIKAVVGMLKGWVATIKNVATLLGKAIFNGIKAGVTGIAAKVGEFITNIKNTIVNWFTRVYNNAKTLGGKIFNGIKDGVAGIAAKVAEFIGNIKNRLITLAGTGPGSIYQKAKDIGAAIFKGIKDGVSGIADAIKTAVESAINWMIKGINKLKIKPVKVLGKTVFPGLGFNIPLIKLAEGGIVTRPTMAMVGEAGPEAVVPLTGSSGRAPIQVRVFIGDTELRGLVRTEIVDNNTGMARTLLAGGVR